MPGHNFPPLFPDNPKARYHYYVCLIFTISTAQTANAFDGVDEIDRVLRRGELFNNMVDFTEFGEHIDEVTTALADMTFNQCVSFFRDLLRHPDNTTIAALEWVQNQIAGLREELAA